MGDEIQAEAFRTQLLSDTNEAIHVGSNKQRNHYFVGDAGAVKALYTVMADFVPEKLHEKFRRVTHEAKKHSVRTREIDGETVILVIKASIDDTTSENGIARMEVEVTMPMTLDELDQKLLDAGFEYQAKWSREREEYKLGDINISLDKNAGYGYLAEFEKVIDDEREAKHAEHELRALMAEFGVEELLQDRLARMFDFYNANWRDYYGTDKVFTVE